MLVTEDVYLKRSRMAAAVSRCPFLTQQQSRLELAARFFEDLLAEYNNRITDVYIFNISRYVVLSIQNFRRTN